MTSAIELLQPLNTSGNDTHNKLNDGAPNPEASLQNEVLKAIRNNDWREAFMMIYAKAYTFSDLAKPLNGKENWTILQHACNIDDEELATEYVQQIFKMTKGFNYSFEELEEFVNHKGNSKQTALHIAISKLHRQVVEDLILNSADVNLVGNDKSQKDPLSQIYDQLHRVLVRVFDKGMEIKTGYDPSNEMLWSIKCNFTSITGVTSRYDKQDDCFRETKLLARVLRQPKVKKADILLHPLIQIFLYLKGIQLRWFIRLSILYHIIWSILSSSFIIHHTKILYAEANTDSNQTFCENAEKSDYILGRIPNVLFYVTVGMFYVMSLVKEVIELYSCPDIPYYWRQTENKGQWTVLIIVPFAAFGPEPFSYGPLLSTCISLVYIVGILAALLLIQGQSSKNERLGIYNHMFSTVFQRFIGFFFAFLPMLLAFVFIFSFLLPESPQFHVEWGLGLAKLVSMMAGEVQYDDVFHPDEPVCFPYPVATKLVFLLFMVVVMILLTNLLIALTVDDVKELKESCKVYHLSAMLEVIYLVEHFLTDPFILSLAHNIFKAKSYPFAFLVGPAKYTVKELPSNCTRPEDDYHIHMMSDLPEEIQDAIKLYKKAEEYTHRENAPV